MHRLRRTFFIALGALCAGAGGIAGQEPQLATAGFPPRSFYIEAGGLPAFEGGPFSVNLEQRVLPLANLRAGVFYGQVDGQMTMKLPILLNVVVPGAAHNIELGGGIRWDVFGASSDDVRLAATIGYRFQELPGGSLLRAGLNFDLRSLSGGSSAWKLAPWPSLSIGFGF